MNNTGILLFDFKNDRNYLLETLNKLKNDKYHEYEDSNSIYTIKHIEPNVRYVSNIFDKNILGKNENVETGVLILNLDFINEQCISLDDIFEDLVGIVGNMSKRANYIDDTSEFCILNTSKETLIKGLK